MGAINPFQKPKAPAPLIIQEAASASEPVTLVETGPTDAEIAQAESEERVRRVLTRNRGRRGTVTTSFRGVLNPSDNANEPSRKTLLGE